MFLSDGSGRSDSSKSAMVIAGYLFLIALLCFALLRSARRRSVDRGIGHWEAMTLPTDKNVELVCAVET